MKKIIITVLLVTGLLFGGLLVDYSDAISNGEPVELASGGPDFSNKDIPPQHTPGGDN